MALFVYGFSGGTSAWAAGRVFNAELSLRGDCTTSSSDTVADPGCPGGTHPGPFEEPVAVLVDSAGDIFVSSRGHEGVGRRIDIFSPAGIYLSGIVPPMTPSSLAIDSQGNLYVTESAAGKAVISRYEPIEYKPASHEIEYPATPTATVINEKEGALFLSSDAGLAVDPKNDDLFVDLEKHASVYSSAAEGNKLLNATIGEGLFDVSRKVAVDGVRRRLYVSDSKAPTHNPDYIRVFEADSPYKLLETLDGSNTPAGKFQTTAGVQSIAVDEETGDFFVDDISPPAATPQVYEFNKNYEYLSTYTHGFQNFLPEIEVDNGTSSPNQGALFVPSVKGGGHAYAFKLKEVGTPEVKEPVFAGEVTETEAELHANINPDGLETEYRFEYVTQQEFEESGFNESAVAGEGTLPVGKEDAEVSAVASGLEPGTSYRFRAFAENEEGPNEKEIVKAFTTYEVVEPPPPCENQSLRTGLSAGLPDCRAYELVTPPSTNGRVPHGITFPGTRILTRETSPLGDKVSFIIEGGSLPGLEGTGAFFGDPYLATRGPKGWTTANAGPDGAESQAPQGGSVSPDQGYSFWSTDNDEHDEGSRVIEGQVTNYVRYPDGDSELVGRGSLGTDPRAVGKFLSEGGTHIVFQTSDKPQQLEPEAPPSGTATVYDRTPDEVTHVVSLLPGNVTPGGKEGAEYAGASADGSGIAFKVGGALYLRLDNTETYEVGKGVAFAGIAEGGGRVFYVEGGDLFAFDAGTEKRTAFTESGDATVVNVSADGTTAYFVSPSVLTGEENPNGAKAQVGKENLYLSEEGSLRFVGTVTKRDVEGDVNETGGLGLWTAAITGGTLAQDPSRATPDGGVLLFESNANLAGYDPEGHTEIYRYDSGSDELLCLSCNPTRTPASGDASLESFLIGGDSEPSFSVAGYVSNLRSDGRRAFFQSSEPLVLADTDGLLDVYEWEADGVGSCEQEGGCVYLISSGGSAHNDFLYAVSDSGDDVFFRTRDLLTGSDAETTTSIYDARVGGGFPEEPAEVCQGEGCRPTLTPPPSLPTPGMLPDAESGNPNSPRHCPKGKHKVKKNGKTRCVKKHQTHHKGKHRK